MVYDVNQINKFITNEYEFIKADLDLSVKDFKKSKPKDGEYIDIRLCIETESDVDGERATQWIFRIGDVSYDQRHSPLCAASSIDGDTVTLVLLESLIDQIMDQIPT